MKTREQVTLKGTRDGFLVLLDDQEEYDALLQQLREKLSSAGKFFQGAGAIVDIGKRELEREDLARLVQMLQGEYGLTVRRVVANLPERNRPEARENVAILRQVGIEEMESEDAAPAAPEPPPPSPAPAPRIPVRMGGKRPVQVEDNALFIYRNLRSGQRINYDGSVIIFGDVNPGAEVVASGDIVVMGAFRGLAHAGARGAIGSVVVAFCLAPTQLRIANLIARAPDEDAAAGTRPEMARVKDGMLIIESYPGWGGD